MSKPYKVTATRPLVDGYVKKTISYTMAYPQGKAKPPKKKRAPAAKAVKAKKAKATKNVTVRRKPRLPSYLNVPLD
jgi:hypothetical protein